MKIIKILGQYWLILIGLLLPILSLIAFLFSYSIGLLLSCLFIIIIIWIWFPLYSTEIEIRNKKYKIFKGFHFSIHLPKFFIIQQFHTFTLNQTFKFTPSCLYRFNTIDDFDVNKLFGINIGQTLEPHTNSFRFGWNCEDNNSTISIYNYEYINGHRYKHKLINVNIDIKYEYQITICNDKIIYEIFDEEGDLIIKKVTKYKLTKEYELAYYCYPYFGGNRTAPHTITLYS